MEETSGQRRETFVVRVLYRQNNTWQGEVLWAEENERRHFRSALELMKLLDSAVKDSAVKDSGEEETERTWRGEGARGGEKRRGEHSRREHTEIPASGN